MRTDPWQAQCLTELTADRMSMWPVDPNARYAGTELETSAEICVRLAREQRAAIHHEPEISAPRTPDVWLRPPDYRPARHLVRRAARATGRAIWAGLISYGQSVSAMYGYPQS